MNSAIWGDVSEFINFLEITQDDVRLARRGWDIVGPHLPAILDRFYSSRIMSGAHKRFPSFDVARLKRKQTAYWENLFSGDYGDVYRAHALKIGHAHKDNSVSLADYILSYGWFLNRFSEVVSASDANPQDRQDIVRAMRTIVFLDLSIAASTYYVTFID